MGGTSFWAREDAAGTVDVLFVEEAARMSFPNVLAVSADPRFASGRNGLSALDHLLNREEDHLPVRTTFALGKARRALGYKVATTPFCEPRLPGRCFHQSSRATCLNKQGTQYLLPVKSAYPIVATRILEPLVTTVARKLFVLPHCRFCGREWLPPEYVSANMAYCSECRDERLALMQSRVRGVRYIEGRNGERVAVPDKR